MLRRILDINKSRSSKSKGVKKSPSTTSSTRCDICSVLKFNSRAAYTCIQCSKQMCRGCLGKHSGDPLLAHHQVIHMTSPSDDNKALHCTLHASERLRQYCVTCKKAVCLVCALSLHDNHEKQSLAAYVTSQRQHLDMLLEESDLKQRCALQTQRDMAAMLVSLEDEMMEARSELQTNYERLLEVMKQKREQLQKRITEKCRGESELYRTAIPD